LLRNTLKDVRLASNRRSRRSRRMMKETKRSKKINQPNRTRFALIYCIFAFLGQQDKTRGGRNELNYDALFTVSCGLLMQSIIRRNFINVFGKKSQ